MLKFQGAQIIALGDILDPLPIFAPKKINKNFLQKLKKGNLGEYLNKKK